MKEVAQSWSDPGLSAAKMVCKTIARDSFASSAGPRRPRISPISYRYIGFGLAARGYAQSRQIKEV